jgi:hypothetical protein
MEIEMSPRRRPVDFSELWWCAARIAGATVNWRRDMGLGPIPAALDAEGTRELFDFGIAEVTRHRTRRGNPLGWWVRLTTGQAMFLSASGRITG